MRAQVFAIDTRLQIKISLRSDWVHVISARVRMPGMFPEFSRFSLCGTEWCSSIFQYSTIFSTCASSFVIVCLCLSYSFIEGVWPCAAHAKGTAWAFHTNNERDTNVTDVIVALWGFDAICYSYLQELFNRTQNDWYICLLCCTLLSVVCFDSMRSNKASELQACKICDMLKKYGKVIVTF